MFTGVSRCLFFFLQLKTAANSGHGRINGGEEPTSCGFWAPSFPFFPKKKESLFFNKDSFKQSLFFNKDSFKQSLFFNKDSLSSLYDE